LGKAKPDALEVARATTRLKGVMGWIGKKVDVAAESFAKELGGYAGKAVIVLGGTIIYPPFGQIVADVIKSVSQWLAHVMLPF
jgi:hypothetical protein